MEVCKEAQKCINKGNIDIEDNIEFRTIRDVTDLFHKNYKGWQRSWIQIADDWSTVASCYQMPENNLYMNELSRDGKTFSYMLKENNLAKKRELIQGIIEHPMKTTYLFLKFPWAKGYKFVGIFEKDTEKMEELKNTDNPKVVYKRVSTQLKV